MKWANVKLILGREIRDQLRDRRTLFMIAVLPLLLYPLLGMSFFQITQFMREHPTKILVVGAEQLANLDDFPPLIDGEHFSPTLFSDANHSDLLQLELLATDNFVAAGDIRPPATESPSVLTDAQHRLEQGEAQLVLWIPPGFAERLTAFHQQLLRHSGASTANSSNQAAEVPAPKIFHNSAREQSQIAYARVARVLDRWTSAIGHQNLRDSRVPVLATRPFNFEMNDVAERGHRSAAVWSKILPFVLLIWALTGAFYPAIDLCAGEKERGTLETLLSSPAQRGEIVWGKLMTVMIFSVATALLNLASMGLTGAFVVSQLTQLGLLPADNQIGLPPLIAFGWLALALLPVAALFSALCLALAAFARSTKEGQYYLMPLLLITTPLMILPMAPGVELNLGNSLIPVTGVVLLLRTMLEGQYLVGLQYTLPVAGVTLLCCLFAIRWAIDQFNQESVLFRESERLDLGLWMRHLVRDRAPTPSISEAICCFVLILLIKFFISLAMHPPTNLVQLVQQVFVSQVVVIGLPAMLMTIMLTRCPGQTLLLAKRPRWGLIPAAVLLGAVLHPIGVTLSTGIQRLYPVNPDVAVGLQKINALLQASPNVWLPLLLIALLPAVCEELAFRGFILSGLRHIGHKWRAIALSSIFFGVAHGVLQQSIAASVMGAIIGYLAVQSGSLIPCILLHCTYNALGFFYAQVIASGEAIMAQPLLRWMLDRTDSDGLPAFEYSWLLLLVCGLTTFYLLRWLQRLPYQKTEEETLQEALDVESWRLSNEEYLVGHK